MSRPYSIGTGFVILLALICACSTVRLRSPYETEYDPNDGMNAEDIRTHFNLHRGRWWNYYKRGLWFLAGQHYDEAREDFARAFQKRPADKWDARTYGMHFIHYFPHRESGIAFCLEGEHERDAATRERLFAEAIEQLKISIDQEPSSKAWFYLKRATAGYWNATQADAAPPAVAIANRAIDRWADVPTLYVNRHTATLEIEAHDLQSGVAAVSVDGRGLFVEAVENDFRDSTIVAIEAPARTKTVAVEATDLAGNTSRPATVKLIVDTSPPTAAITIHPESQSLFGGRIPVEISAADDQGLKSIQAGEDPYDRRECGGRRTWDDTLYARPGARKFVVKVTDRAGNVTATDISLEPEQGTNRPGGEAHLRYRPYPYYGNRLWSYASRDAARPLAQLSYPQLQPTAPQGFGPPPGYSGVPKPASYGGGSPAAKLVFREFRDRTLVQTTHENYFLQGEVRYAKGPVTIKITIDGKQTKTDAVTKTGDYTIFCDRVSLIEPNKVRSIVVEAVLQDGTIISSRDSNLDLRVERVQNRMYEPNAVYSIMLLPLEERSTPTDPSGAHRDPERAHEVVLDALRSCTLPNPDDPNCRRFKCDALKMWTMQKAKSELSRLRITGSSPEKKCIRMSQEYENTTGLPVELGFYGQIIEDANSLEVILDVFDITSGRHPFPKIDIFGSKADPNWHTDGLKSKLLQMIPRVTGQIIDLPQPGTIVIDRGSDAGVFYRMGVRVYEETENGCSTELCRGRIGDFRRTTARVQLTDTSRWNYIRRNPSPRRRFVHVVGK